MQIVLHVLAKPSTTQSLREQIIHDLNTTDFGLDVLSESKRGRSPGWAKIGASDCYGVINIQWDAASLTLTGRAVSKRGNYPDDLVGRFVSYLTRKRHADIAVMTIRSI